MALDYDYLLKSIWEENHKTSQFLLESDAKAEAEAETTGPAAVSEDDRT